MSGDVVPDFARVEQELRADILAGGQSREQLLDEIRGSLRDLRLDLPTYKEYQDAGRYRLFVEDIDEFESTYKQLADDTAGIFQDDDYVDLLTQTRTKLVVMTVALNRALSSEVSRAATPPLSPPSKVSRAAKPPTRRATSRTTIIGTVVGLVVVGWVALLIVMAVVRLW